MGPRRSGGVPPNGPSAAVRRVAGVGVRVLSGSSVTTVVPVVTTGPHVMIELAATTEHTGRIGTVQTSERTAMTETSERTVMTGTVCRTSTRIPTR